MKRLLISMLMVMLTISSASATLSVVWDQVYDQYETDKIEGVIGLANGDFLACFLRYDQPTLRNYLHVIRFTIDGIILDEYEFDSYVIVFSFVGVMETMDGGAIIMVQTNDGPTLGYWNGNGEFVGSRTFDPSVLSEFYDVILTPDNKLIFVGADPNIICLNLNGDLLWEYNYDGWITIALDEVIRRHNGVYMSLGYSTTSSLIYPIHAIFTRNGDFRYVDLSAQYGSFEGCLTLSETSDNPVSVIIDEWDWPLRVKIKKHNYEWSCILTDNLSLHNRWSDVKPFRGEGGYLVLFYYPYDDITTKLYEVSESGELLDTITETGREFRKATPTQYGGMIVMGTHYDLNSGAWHLTLSRVQTETTQLPVSAKIWLLKAPRSLGPSGGLLNYKAVIGNDLDEVTPIRFVTSLIYPDNSAVVLAEETITLTPNEPIVYPDRRFMITADYPVGRYKFVVEAISQDEELVSHSHFVFYKDVYEQDSEDIVFASSGELEPAEIPDYQLLAAHPNPFNAATTINVTLPQAAELSVRVFDIQGRRVATLADGSSIVAGSHSFSFDGSDLSSGIYFVLAKVPGQLSEVRKLVLVK